MARFLSPSFCMFCSEGVFPTSVRQSFKRLNPVYQWHNPVMFVVYCCALLMTVDLFTYSSAATKDPYHFVLYVTLTLWFTVLFANFAEAYAENMARKQTDQLHQRKLASTAKLLTHSFHNKKWKEIPARHLEKGDTVLVEEGDFIPADGTIIEGIATIDESAITGESAPVIRESGSDHDQVISGTRVLSDWIVIQVSAPEGDSYIDKMLAMVDGSKRPKTPIETALETFLIATTIITLVACVSLIPFTIFSTQHMHEGIPISIATIITLIVCLVPTTIGGLLSPIGISGMRQLLVSRVLATSPRAVESAGDIDILLIDKTGTITMGNRQAVDFLPAKNVTIQELAEASFLASCADKTPEGKSITELAYKTLESRPPVPTGDFTFIPFSAETRASGITLGEDKAILKGAVDVIETYVGKLGGLFPAEVALKISEVSRQGGTPLVVADGSHVLGIIHLKDVVKEATKDKLALLRRMGVKSIMITGDNPITSAAIASEAGVDDFVAQATPEVKLKLIRKLREDGHMVAVAGDGTNDAPALAQADVGVVMNTGTQAAKEAGNMIDLDSSPSKLAQIVWIGRHLAITRGSLTAFTLASDLSKFLAIISAVFLYTIPSVAKLNILHLSTSYNALLAALIFNALLIIILIPIALQGVTLKMREPDGLHRRQMLIYGCGGFAFSLIGLKIIDYVLCLFDHGGLS